MPPSARRSAPSGRAGLLFQIASSQQQAAGRAGRIPLGQATFHTTSSGRFGCREAASLIWPVLSSRISLSLTAVASATALLPLDQLKFHVGLTGTQPDIANRKVGQRSETACRPRLSTSAACRAGARAKLPSSAPDCLTSQTRSCPERSTCTRSYRVWSLPIHEWAASRCVHGMIAEYRCNEGLRSSAAGQRDQTGGCQQWQFSEASPCHFNSRFLYRVSQPRSARLCTIDLRRFS
jgi:hypothetical protein